MSLYSVNPGCVLQLDNIFYQPSELVELTGETETAVLAEQGWKLQLVDPPEPAPVPRTSMPMISPGENVFMLTVDDDGALIVTST